MSKYHCRCISYCCCGVATEVCVAKLEWRLHSILFYGDPVQIVQGLPFYPYLRWQTRLHLMCGFCFDESVVFYLALSSGFEIIKKKTCRLFLLSLHSGMNFDPCAIVISNASKTSRGNIKQPLHCIPMAKQSILYGHQECDVKVVRCIPNFYFAS